MSDTRTLQQKTSRALTDLLNHDLAEACWDINTVYPGRLDGQIPAYTAPVTERRKQIDKWATFLNAPVVLNHKGKNSEHWKVSATYRGVKVTIWTSVQEHKAFQAPAEQPGGGS